MQNKNKQRRSVAIQSTDFTDAEVASKFTPTILCKKTGFRNLLHQSVTVLPPENGHINETIGFNETKATRGVQTTFNSNLVLQKCSFAQRCVFNYPSSPGSVSETIKIFETEPGTEIPGTSKLLSTAISSYTVYSQMAEAYETSREESLGVVYNYSDKEFLPSRISNPFYRGSQGSRRYSNETVTLIEDYLSYDYSNAAGRQNSQINNAQSVRGCCGGRKKKLSKSLARPVPISTLEDIEEEEDEESLCRICHEGDHTEPLIQPCLCRGSIKSVHARCLKIWLEQSNMSRCELCNYPYAIKQTMKYSKWVSLKVFFKSAADRRALVYDSVTFITITPLTLVGVIMCIKASSFSTSDDPKNPNSKIANITRVGMIMLSVTIIVAYGVWVYTLLAFHYKCWKKWYSTCFDVEVLPVRMTSEERIEAANRLNEEMSRRQRGSTAISVLQTPRSNSIIYYPRRITASELVR